MKTHGRRLLAMGLVGALLLGTALPFMAAAQGDDDDDDLNGGALAVLLLAVGGAVAHQDLGPGAKVQVERLQAAVEGARRAEAAGDLQAELADLGRGIGAAKALLGMTSLCGTECQRLQRELREIIRILTVVKDKLSHGARGLLTVGGSSWSGALVLAD